ncbi:MAG: hypothetical protein ACRCX2_18495 [Paraclostridium sp.]
MNKDKSSEDSERILSVNDLMITALFEHLNQYNEQSAMMKKLMTISFQRIDALEKQLGIQQQESNGPIANVMDPQAQQGGNQIDPEALQQLLASLSEGGNSNGRQ